jgi:hypothetical protein
MNVHQRFDGPAQLRYATPDFDVIKPGEYVVCAVSNRRIPLEALRYWSVERQEAYFGPEEAAARLAGEG